jgi:hypothetical protein
MSVRRRILEAESEAEHALLDILEALSRSDSPHDVLANQGAEDDKLPLLAAMAAIAEAWLPPAPSTTLARLVEAL